MLADSDRIFTNLYGQRDWRSKSARGRGDWDGTKELIFKGRDWIIERVKVRAPRTRRRRLPDRPQSGLSCQRRATARPICRQCR
jgi:hypothetical protein